MFHWPKTFFPFNPNTKTLEQCHGRRAARANNYMAVIVMHAACKKPTVIAVFSWQLLPTAVSHHFFWDVVQVTGLQRSCKDHLSERSRDEDRFKRQMDGRASGYKSLRSRSPNSCYWENCSVANMRFASLHLETIIIIPVEISLCLWALSDTQVHSLTAARDRVAKTP